MIKNISIEEVEYIAFRMAREMLTFDEPIPDFATRYPHILESCLATPFVRFANRPAYRSLISRASILFYLMIKNHPFQNGNKRIAITTLLVFLNKNEKWLTADTQQFYNFTLWVAQSPAEVKDEVVRGIEKFTINHLVSIGK